MGKIVKIGNASGFWGDSAVAAPQLVQAGIDYLVFDYLAELTMSILVAQRAKDPALGYATDFVEVAMKSSVRDIAAKRIKVVSNAGGVNPRGCAAALQTLCAQAGVSLKIAVVEGDDLMAQVSDLRDSTHEMFSAAPMPEKLLSANAYLGAFPIARALALGADIVITGRCVDSAVALGPLIHEFGWGADDYDLLASGSLVGHILECGCQATGGLFTDWESVPDWHNMGYPIAECREDGSFTVTKAAHTGGLVTPATVGEQMLYEIGDPRAYIMPDVVCDFSQVTMVQEAPNRVAVQGAKGYPSTTSYKVSSTYMDGYKASAQLLIVGIDAAKKARRSAEAILARTRAMFKRLGWEDYCATQIEIIGAEQNYGPHARTQATREATMRLTVTHANAKALGLFSREVAPAGTSWSPGTTGGGGGRTKPTPHIKLYSWLVDKARISIRVSLKGQEEVVPTVSSGGYEASLHRPPEVAGPSQTPPTDSIAVPLIRLAYARSGDKGNNENIGIIARDPIYLPVLRAELTPEKVKAHFAYFVEGDVTRYEVPGIHGLNFLLREALGGGGMASLRVDPLGKGFGQMMLDMPVHVPREWGLA
jgi:Acyclic terpene utilisation family protein AtuA